MESSPLELAQMQGSYGIIWNPIDASRIDAKKATTISYIRRDHEWMIYYYMEKSIGDYPTLVTESYCDSWDSPNDDLDAVIRYYQ